MIKMILGFLWTIIILEIAFKTKWYFEKRKYLKTIAIFMLLLETCTKKDELDKLEESVELLIEINNQKKFIKGSDIKC